MRIFINMKKRILEQKEIDNIIKMYSEENLGSYLIFQKTGINRKRILNILKKHNVPLRESGRQFIGGVKAANKRYIEKPGVKTRKKEISKIWSENNKEHRKEYMKNYRSDNYDSIKQTKRTYEKNRKSIDPIYKLIGNFRTAIYTVLKENNVKKHGHYFEILGYTQEDLKFHLENLFTEGMTWDNYGEWHVDHIRPITSFTFKDISDDEFKECWSLENLQPMWGSENISKSNHYEI